MMEQERAVKFAKLSLIDKKRYSGDDILDHCLNVATILKKYGVSDQVTLSVAILHHSISEGIANFDDVEKEFGSDISSMLKTLESLRVVKVRGSSEYAENLRKMFLAIAKDLRIVLIKLADILDNLQTLKFTPKTKQLEVSKETLEIFAPLAERLGMGEMKGEMQDLAFPFIYPKEYKDTKKILSTSLRKLNKKLLRINKQLKLALDQEKIPFSIESRAKHLYSLFKKLKREEINFDISKVYDLIAFRVLVKSAEDCYRVLGIIHSIWRPLPGRLRDYIASPLPNGYQSIHTTVFGPDGDPFEIQIRTEKMHEESEYGIAAHWHYDEAKNKGLSGKQLNKGIFVDKKLIWVQNLRKWQEEVTDNSEFLKSVRTDFFGPRIFVLTPKGDVKDLPEGSTPIDFGYSIHTELGHRAVGAKVNGKMSSLSQKLKSGDVIEILVSKDSNKKPSKDWLKFVVTSSAKSKIKRAYKII